MIIILSKPATDEDVKKALEHYEDYIKVTIDIEQETVSIGGEYHYDSEQILLARGSKQDNIWGGGLKISTKTIRTNAMINLRTNRNASAEILDAEIREKFISILKKFLYDFV